MRSARRLESEGFGTDQVRHFWSKVDIRGESECWEWSAYRNKKGYGVIVLGGRSLLSHRMAYAAEFGSAPARTLVLHSCDNPPCCNPRHLSLGSNEDNMREMIERGRSRSSRPGDTNPRARLTPAQVAFMRATYASLPRGSKIRWRHEVAERLGVSERAVAAAIYGENWSDEWILRDGADVVKKAMFGA